jgi:hypothetical protein
MGSWGLVAHVVEAQLRYPLLLTSPQPSTMAQLTAQAAICELPDGAMDLNALCLQPEGKLQKKLTQARHARDLATQRGPDTPLHEHVLLGNLPEGFPSRQ